MTNHQTLSFPINNWGHLYSLQQAISHYDQLTGRKLTIHGQITNADFLNKINTPITLEFMQSSEPPAYPALENGLHVLGEITLASQNLTSCIPVDKSIFEELRKNIMEYADIEGIHIILSLEVLSHTEHWLENESLQIVQLNYAMKGDG